MNSGEWRQSLEVARWEFRRFVKPKQLLASLVLTVLAGAIGYGLARLAARSARADATIAVIGGEVLGLTAATSGDGITFVVHPPSAHDSLRAAVAARAVDGLLVVRGIDVAELTVAREPVWRDRLDERLAAARQQVKLRETGLPPARLVEILSPVRLDVRFHEAARGRGARWVALFAGGIVFYGVFMAAAYIFVSVTGEKQLRVTEQVLSIIRPQTWIDGKIIGIAGVAVVSVLAMALGVLLFLVGRALASDAPRLPSMSGDPIALILILVFSLLGFAFWLAFLGAVAATVDDPNTSTRGPLIFLPAFFSMTAFMIVRNPDSLFARTVGLLPVTAPAAMPARLAMTDVHVWEIALSILLLAAATWLMRSAAGRIFAVGMLLYGKEASWREIARWVRKV